MANNQLKLLESFKGVNVLVIGDFMLDHYTWGSVDRISPEAPVVVVKVSKESVRAGGAGNVAANLAELGARVQLCGLTGEDEGRELLNKRLSSREVDCSGLVSDSSRQTTSKTRVLAHSQQVVRVDKESLEPLSTNVEEKLKESLLKKLPEVQGVIISDYGKGVWSKALHKILFDNISDSIPVIFDPKPVNKRIYLGGSLVTPNRKEAEELSGMSISSVDDAVKAGEKIIADLSVKKALVTLGEKGMVLVEADGQFSAIETEAREVYDVSGAGDTVVSVMGLGLAAGASALDSAKLANTAAGIVVGEVGTVAIEASKLAEHLK